MALCSNDEDCNPLETNKLCYADIRGFDNSTYDDLGCACNTFYGWEGSDCNELSYSSYISIAVGCVVVLANLISLFRSCTLSCMLWAKGRGKVKGCNRFTPGIVTNIFVIIASFGLAIWALAVVLSTFFTSGEYWVEVFAEFDPYKGRANLLSLVGGIVGIFGALLCVVYVAIMWLDLTYKTLNMDPNYTKAYKRNRKFLKYLLVFSVFMSIGAFGYEKLIDGGTSVNGLVFPIVILVIIIWYMIACWKITKVLKSTTKVPGSSSTMSKRFRSILVNIRCTTYGIIFWLLLYMLTGIAYSVLDTYFDSWKRFSAVGEFKIAKIAHHLQFVSTSMAVLTINGYLVQNFRAGSEYASKWGFVWTKQSQLDALDSGNSFSSKRSLQKSTQVDDQLRNVPTREDFPNSDVNF